MRINTGKKPSFGENRVATRFLWLPVRLGSQIRWLETATTRQVYCESFNPFRDLAWVDLEFLD